MISLLQPASTSEDWELKRDVDTRSAVVLKASQHVHISPSLWSRLNIRLVHVYKMSYLRAIQNQRLKQHFCGWVSVLTWIQNPANPKVLFWGGEGSSSHPPTAVHYWFDRSINNGINAWDYSKQEVKHQNRHPGSLAEFQSGLKFDGIWNARWSQI